MGDFGAQLRQVLRRLGRAKLFTAVVIITLAAGVGANAVIFAVLESVLLKPLPYPKPNELVGVWLHAPGLNIKELNLSPSTYFIARDQGEAFQDIGVYTGDSVSITGTGEPEQVDGVDMTDGVLGIIRAKPALGRLFSRADAEPNAPATVVITHGYWAHKFGSDPGVVGRSVVMDGVPHQIIGVLSKDFTFPNNPEAQFVLPFQFDRAKLKLGNYSFNGIARLKPGTTIERANTDIARMLPIVNRSFPLPDGFSLQLFESAHITPDVHPLKQDVVGDVGPVLWILMASIGGVLLIACANVANLLLVRVEGRRQ